MLRKRMVLSFSIALAASLGCWALNVVAQPVSETKSPEKKAEKKPEKPKEVWTDPADPMLPIDFKFQGEFAAANFDGKFGAGDACQVIALGGGALQAVVYQGGLPGAGWDGKNRSVMEGKLMGEEGVARVQFQAATGKRKYLAQSPQEFSATRKFPPVGQRELVASYPAKLGLTDWFGWKLRPSRGLLPSWRRRFAAEDGPVDVISAGCRCGRG